MRAAIVIAALASCGGKQKPAPEPAPGPNELRTVASFDSIADRATRSRALFTEAGRVLVHPRCLNCHPDGDSPTQRNAMERHDPPVTRGQVDQGVVGMACTTCHQDRNQELTRIPGAPGWHLAPIQMAWQGKSLAQICNQLKDPARNGDKTLGQIAEHAAQDPLVAWGWSPGADRESAPGNQVAFGALIDAWVRSGAECPEESR